VPVLVIDGRGFGHGVGMAQDGAFWMGRAGASTDKILAQFYPGTRPGRSRGTVRVPVLEATPTRSRRTSVPATAVVQFPNGGEIRDTPSGSQGAGFPVRVPPGGEARIVFEQGRYRAERTGGRSLGRLVLAASRRQIPPIETPPTPTTEPPPTAPPVPEDPVPAPPGEPAPPESQPAPGPGAVSARPLWAVPADGGTVSLPARQRRYRGMIEATAAASTLRLVNQVDVEQYLKGMGEVLDPSWPPASLRAQAIAARTYALRAMATSGEVCETQRCQVYLGAQAEYGAMNKAVDATASQVLLFGGGLASTVYSANGGGFSASPEEGFGTVGQPSYLRPAPYTTKDPLPWSLTVALRDVRGRFGYPGQLTGARVTRTGPSGRALEVTLDGSAGPRTVSGIAFDAGLGLRSTLFSLRVDVGEAPPPPPPEEGVAVQALPGDPGDPTAEVAAAHPTAVTAAATVGTAPGSVDGVRLAATVVAAWSLLAVGGAGLVLRTWWTPAIGAKASDATPARPRRDGPARRSEGPGSA
ncbi:MAG: SpoIID/LytB domain-containing protein, partial [Actinobacteria bacterium]|nr:SpoIID/LytB domain-containing protein [Actinomycetota bacterium]